MTHTTQSMESWEVWLYGVSWVYLVSIYMSPPSVLLGKNEEVYEQTNIFTSPPLNGFNIGYFLLLGPRSIVCVCVCMCVPNCVSLREEIMIVYCAYRNIHGTCPSTYYKCCRNNNYLHPKDHKTEESGALCSVQLNAVTGYTPNCSHYTLAA